MPNPKNIRKQIREARQAVPANYAKQASFKFSERIGGMDAYKNANSIAAFLAFDGEADPRPLMERALLEKKAVYVPIIIAKAEPLLFASWTKETPLKKNSFGILEPDVPRESLIEGNKIECVITPLIAFDEKRNRIGMGGGFYDRTFAFTKNEETNKTALIGIAYEFQKVDKIDVREWDVSLSAVATELAIY